MLNLFIVLYLWVRNGKHCCLVNDVRVYPFTTAKVIVAFPKKLLAFLKRLMKHFKSNEVVDIIKITFISSRVEM